MRAAHVRTNVKPEDFIRAWNTGKTVEEVAKSLGVKSLQTIKSRAALYRKKGITLQKFAGKRGSPLNVDLLKRIAAETLPKGKNGLARKNGTKKIAKKSKRD